MGVLAGRVSRRILRGGLLTSIGKGKSARLVLMLGYRTPVH